MNHDENDIDEILDKQLSNFLIFHMKRCGYTSIILSFKTQIPCKRIEELISGNLKTGLLKHELKALAQAFGIDEEHIKRVNNLIIQ